MWRSMFVTFIFIQLLCQANCRPELQLESPQPADVSQQVEEKVEEGTLLSFKLPDKLLADIEFFDKLDLEKQLSNKKFVELQVRCLVYDQPCDIFGRKAKALLPAVILDNCRLCSSKHKHKLSRVVVHIQQNYPGAWNDALQKYGNSPKFITAGQAAPSSELFAIRKVLIPPQSTISSASVLQLQSTQIFNPSPAPELIAAVESPTPPMEPTSSPNWMMVSSSQPPSTSVVESTLEVRPTTSEP